MESKPNNISHPKQRGAEKLARIPVKIEPTENPLKKTGLDSRTHSR